MNRKICKTCKVFGGDGVNNVIHEEKVCSDNEEKDLHSRFPEEKSSVSSLLFSLFTVYCLQLEFIGAPLVADQ
jgi:hypothetical protein